MKNIDSQYNKIDEQLKEYFREKGITQESIAKKLGITQAAVSAMLNGKPFGKKQAAKWGEVFGIQPSWLLTGMGEMFIDSEEKPSGDLRRALELKQDNVDLLLEQNRREREYAQTILSIAEQLLDMVERGETINVKEFRARLKLVA